MFEFIKDIRDKNITMHYKLSLFIIAITLMIIIVFSLLLSVFGITGHNEKAVESHIDTELSILEDNINNDFGQISLNGISIAEEIVRISERFFEENNIKACELKNNTDMIEPLLADNIHILLNTINNKYCGGVYIMLDASINSENVNNKAGVFLKKTQPMSTSTSGVSIYYLRGPAQIARDNNIMLIAQWQMEYNIANQDFFNKVMETVKDNSDLPLSRLYYWSRRIVLKNNSEAGFLLCVPLISEDNTVFGVCGIEVSDRMFKTSYTPEGGSFENIFTVMSPFLDECINTSQGLVAGNQYLTGNHWETDLIKTGVHNNFTHYSDGEYKFGGKKANLKLYPDDSPYSEESWSVAILMPQDVLHEHIEGNSDCFRIIIILLVIGSVVASIMISHYYVKPINEAFDKIKQKNYTKGDTDESTSEYSEIEDLFEFLAQKDNEHEEMLELKQQEMDNLQKEFDKKIADMSKTINATTDYNKDNYKMFISNLHTLTPREREVFNLYLEGKSSKEIIATLGFSDNALKYHNKNIYSKLGVTSRKELLKYAAIMKQEE